MRNKKAPEEYLHCSDQLTHSSIPATHHHCGLKHAMGIPDRQYMPGGCPECSPGNEIIRITSMSRKENAKKPDRLCQGYCGEETSIATRESGSERGIKRDGFLPFPDARELVRSLGLKSQVEWWAYCASGKKPYNIPASARRVYRKEWAGWGDFLGTGRVANKNRRFLPFKQARHFVHSLGLRSSKEWVAYCQSGRKPDNVPAQPSKVYRGWAGIGDWLGTGNRRSRNFRSFRAACKFVRALGLRSHAEWRDYCLSGKKPDDIPAHPNVTYKKNWRGYGDFLGTGNIWKRNREFLPFNEAREYVHRLGFKSKEEWNYYATSKARPRNIPVAPWRVYRHEWLGYADWLGNLGFGNRWTPRAIEAYLKSIAREI